MYYEYWGLQKPPFDNVPDPSMYVDCHRSMEVAIEETLFAIEEGNECIAVIVGDVGLGKTLSIRMIMDSLETDHYTIALISNPGISFAQMMQEIISQLSNRLCTENDKLKLLGIFNQLLFSLASEGKRILIFIDEANAITPINLENLRLLTNMQDEKANLFTLILAGQNEFARRLEHPKRANFFQRIGTYCRIDKLDSVDDVEAYVKTRLRLAGASADIFRKDSFGKIWKHSDEGVPRLINKVCKLCLSCAESRDLTSIDGELVDRVGDRGNTLSGLEIQLRKPRRRLKRTSFLDCRDSRVLPFYGKYPPRIIGTQDAAQRGKLVIAHRIGHPDRSGTINRIIKYERSSSPTKKTLMLIPHMKSIDSEITLIYEQSLQETETQATKIPSNGHRNDVASPAFSKVNDDQIEERKHAVIEIKPPIIDFPDELKIGDFLIKIDIPENVFTLYQTAAATQRAQMAGSIAAEALKMNPQLTQSYVKDPVPVWQEIRDFILQRLNDMTTYKHNLKHRHA